MEFDSICGIANGKLHSVKRLVVRHNNGRGKDKIRIQWGKVTGQSIVQFGQYKQAPNYSARPEKQK